MWFQLPRKQKDIMLMSAHLITQTGERNSTSICFIPVSQKSRQGHIWFDKVDLAELCGQDTDALNVELLGARGGHWWSCEGCTPMATLTNTQSDRMSLGLPDMTDL